MKFLERVSSLLRPTQDSHKSEIHPGLRSLFDEARRAKLAENYPAAHQKLEQALEMTKDAVDHPAAVEIFLQRADVCAREGDFAQAARALDGARAKAGEHRLLQAYVLIGRGRLAAAEGKTDEAAAYYDQAAHLAREIHADGALGRAQGLRGELALRDGNASYALHLLREALPRLNSAGDGELSPLLVGVLGLASIETGQVGEGVRLLERALRIADQLGDAAQYRRWALLLGERALADARYLDARSTLRLAAERFGERRTHEHVHLLNRLCFVLNMLGERDEALRIAERAVHIAAGQPPQTEALARASLGSALLGLGRSVDAIPHLRAAAASTAPEERVEVLRALAAALAGSGDSEEALRVCREAVADADLHGTPLERAQTRRDLGLLHYRAGAWHDAVTVWTTALALFEEHNAHAQAARLYCDLGSARRLLGMHQRALRDYEQALVVLNSVDAHDLETRGLVYSNAAHAFAEQGGDPDSVDSFFTEAVALAEKTGDRAAESLRRGNYGYFLVQTGRPRRAIALLEQALRASEALGLQLQAAIQCDNLGLAHAASGEYPTALAYHRRALETVQSLDAPHWRTSIEINLCRTLLLMGETESVAHDIRAAVQAAREDGSPELLTRALLVQAQSLLRENPAAAAPLIDEALHLARRADLRCWVAEALALSSEQQAAAGSLEAARATWHEAAEHFNRLRMPQGKRQPAWLSKEKA